MPLAIATIGDLVPPSDRGRWQGLTGAVFGVASILGPTTGGYIADNADWRWVFLVSLPVALIALVVVATTLKIPPHPERATKIDYTGAALLAAGLSAALLGLVRGGQEAPWGSAQVLGLIGAGVGAARGVPLVGAARRRSRSCPSSCSSIRTVSAASLAGFATGVGMFGTIMFVPLFVQGVLGGSATSSGPRADAADAGDDGHERRLGPGHHAHGPLPLGAALRPGRDGRRVRAAEPARRRLHARPHDARDGRRRRSGSACWCRTSRSWSRTPSRAATWASPRASRSSRARSAARSACRRWARSSPPGLPGRRGHARARRRRRRRGGASPAAREALADAIHPIFLIGVPMMAITLLLVTPDPRAAAAPRRARRRRAARDARDGRARPRPRGLSAPLLRVDPQLGDLLAGAVQLDLEDPGDARLEGLGHRLARRAGRRSGRSRARGSPPPAPSARGSGRSRPP